MFKRYRNVLLLVLVSVLSACAAPEGSVVITPNTPAVASRMELVREIKEYQKRLGWEPTGNFLRYDDTLVAYSFCVYTGEFDFRKVVIWDDKDGCPERERRDRSFSTVEAVAGHGVPISRSLVSANLPRFVYVTFHEDFHEQIADIPTLALNESATQLVGLYAAQGFLREKYGADSEIHRIFVNAAEMMLVAARIEREYHRKLSELYDRVGRGEAGRTEGLREKARLYEEMRRSCAKLGQDVGLYTSCAYHMNNADLDSALAYSAFYEQFYRLHVCLGGDARETSLALMRLVRETVGGDEGAFIGRVERMTEQGCR